MIEGSISVEKFLAFCFGVIFAIILVTVAIAIPNPTNFTLFVFRVILALVAAGIGAVLPGLMEINLPWVRAGGALALAAVVYFVNPPALIRDSTEQKARTALDQAYAAINHGNMELARDHLEKTRILSPEPLEVPYFVGLIHKRQYKYDGAEHYFRVALKRNMEGQRFLSDRSEANIRTELGTALDGQGHLLEALSEFRKVLKIAAIDSYYELDASYEVARLSLAVWLSNRGAANLPYLDSAIKDFDFWLSRDWNKLSTKIWGYYHAVCARNERIGFAHANNTLISEKDERLLKQHLKEFENLARNAEGVRKYEIRFTAFVLAAEDYEHHPGEPLRCGLNNIMQQFRFSTVDASTGYSGAGVARQRIHYTRVG